MGIGGQRGHEPQASSDRKRRRRRRGRWAGARRAQRPGRCPPATRARSRDALRRLAARRARCAPVSAKRARATCRPTRTRRGRGGSRRRWAASVSPAGSAGSVRRLSPFPPNATTAAVPAPRQACLPAILADVAGSDGRVCGLAALVLAFPVARREYERSHENLLRSLHQRQSADRLHPAGIQPGDQGNGTHPRRVHRLPRSDPQSPARRGRAAPAAPGDVGRRAAKPAPARGGAAHPHRTAHARTHPPTRVPHRCRSAAR